MYVLIDVKTTARSQLEGEVGKYLFSFNFPGVCISHVSSRENVLHFNKTVNRGLRKASIFYFFACLLKIK